MSCDFFISRTGVDAEMAQWIAGELEAAGFTTLYQDRDSHPGKSFIEFMQRGAECGHTLLVLSPEYLQAEFTQPEWQAAFRRGRFIPILVRPCDIPALLAHYVYIDLIDKGEDERRGALLKGVAHLRRVTPAELKVSVAKLPTVNPMLIGREREFRQLDEAWKNPGTGLVSIIAFGGVGKTSLAINWWHKNGASGAARILGWSFHSQGAAEDRQASADPFLDHALRVWFGVAEPPRDSWQRGEMLADRIRRERTLLILDGLEPLQFPPGPQHGILKDPGMAALLKELAAHNPGLCICTSRAPLTEVDSVVIDLDNLTPEAGAEYLRELGVQGTDGELRAASEEFGNHALALTLLGNYLVKRRGGDVRRRDTVPSLFLYDAGKGGHARRMLRHYERIFKDTPELSVLRLLGLFDRPADPGAIAVLRTLPEDEWCSALENLKDARLIEYTDPNGPLDCHPLVREHFAEELRESNLGAFRKAHSRLYEHYSKQAHQPDTIAELTPLFYAVYHGCRAGRHQEACNQVYYERILGGNSFFLTQQLGAFGTNLSLLANFFDSPWSKPVAGLAAQDQTWVLAQAGFTLRALGRLSEAVEPMLASAEAAFRAEDWVNTARRFNNLSELYLTLGRIRDAIDASNRAVEYADRSGNTFQRSSKRATLADALHQSGEVSEARRLFEEAEAIEGTALSSLRGYQYCVLDPRKIDQVTAQPRGTLLTGALYNLLLGNFEEAVSGLRRAGQLDDLPRGLLARAAHFRQTGAFDKAQHDLDEVRTLATRCGMKLYLADYHLEQARLLFLRNEPNLAQRHYEAAKALIEETGYHRRDRELAELQK